MLELCRDWRRLETQAKTAYQLATEQDSANFRAEAQLMLSWTLSERGELDEAVRLMRTALRERERRSGRLTNPYYLSLAARVQASAGALDDAFATLDAALEAAHTGGDYWTWPDLSRIRGDFLLQKGHAVEAAEQCFSSALKAATAISGRAWELRAATSLATLWAAQGRKLEALRLLMPIYQAFEEGFDTSDLKDAHMLLTTLS